MTAPCKGCEKRTATCHAECVDYMLYVLENSAQRDSRRREDMRHHSPSLETRMIEIATGKRKRRLRA